VNNQLVLGIGDLLIGKEDGKKEKLLAAYRSHLENER
jgi:hypothetical protein